MLSDGRNGRVQSVDRALNLLEALGADGTGKRLGELAARTGLAPSTVHRLLTTLEDRRFVQFSSADGQWHVGRQAFTVGEAFMTEPNFGASALPIMRRLRDQTHETVNLGTVEDGQVKLVSQVRSREIARSLSRVGGHAPMLASGMGKAILAFSSPGEVSDVVQRCGLRRITANTLTRREELERQLSDVLRDGYAVDDEEFLPSLRCVASAVFDAKARIVCALSVSALPSRMPKERIPVIGRLLVDAVNDLMLSINGRAPAPAPCA